MRRQKSNFYFKFEISVEFSAVRNKWIYYSYWIFPHFLDLVNLYAHAIVNSKENVGKCNITCIYIHHSTVNSMIISNLESNWNFSLRMQENTFFKTLSTINIFWKNPSSQKLFSAATVQLGKWDSIRVDFIIWLSMIGLVILLSCIHYRYTTK